VSVQRKAAFQQRSGLAAIAALDEDDPGGFVPSRKDRRETAGRFGAADEEVDEKAAGQASHSIPIPAKAGTNESSLRAERSNLQSSALREAEDWRLLRRYAPRNDE
jgi:predicted pyridoxine 5'-phosphate oxidase superfamily flavin-nucleotide-binding protein